MSTRVDINDLKIIKLTEDSKIEDFSCGSEEIDIFLTKTAKIAQIENTSRTHLVYLNDDLVGFFSLICDSITQKDIEIQFQKENYVHKVYPAVKITRLAVRDEYQGKGIGHALLYYALGVVYALQRYVACRFVIVDAKPDAIDFYKKFGFHSNITSKNKHLLYF
ncbi:MAG: GNAT family N-acetyltransferase, partial [Methanomicrobiales archaeon]|nr:GNAT family N-acetyltransferase [Methanomicrobiales archaeon]